MSLCIDWFEGVNGTNYRCKLCNLSFSNKSHSEDLNNIVLDHLIKVHNVSNLPASAYSATDYEKSNFSDKTTECKNKTASTINIQGENPNFSENSSNVGVTGSDVKRKQTRVWSDGCYDMVHFGHANQLRQTKAMGDYLVVGVHSDAEIIKHKGPPVFTQEERYKIVKSIKWVDEVVQNAPYITSLDTLDRYDCDFCVHGSDITLDSEGLDTYRFVKAAGRYRECQRTIGVSTTDLVERMLEATNNNNNNDFCNEKTKRPDTPCSRVSRFLPSTRKIVEFASPNGHQGPKQGDKIVYVAGAFDIFHVAHVDFLEQVSRQGDYIIVGIFSDKDINRRRGSNFPIMNLQERVLSVLACKYVNEVVMEAPYSITEELLDHFKIDIVCHGKTQIDLDEHGRHPYEVAKELGKYVEVDSGNKLTTQMVVERIVNKRHDFIKRNVDKEAKETKQRLLDTCGK